MDFLNISFQLTVISLMTILNMQPQIKRTRKAVKISLVMNPLCIL